MGMKQVWGKFLGAVGMGAAEPRIVGAAFDNAAERARLMRLPPAERVALLEQALRAEPGYRAQLAEASAAWGTWKQTFVVKRMRQALGPSTTKEELQTLIDTYRRLPA